MKRTLQRLMVIGALGMLAAVLPATGAWAGSPHFPDNMVTFSQNGNTLTVAGKEAGLGDELQIHVVLQADANCVNPGNNRPQAANKMTVTAAGDFPVQNGKAYFTLSVTAVFVPSAPCPDPMTIAYSNITVTDVTNGVTASP